MTQAIKRASHCEHDATHRTAVDDTGAVRFDWRPRSSTPQLASRRRNEIESGQRIRLCPLPTAKSGFVLQPRRCSTYRRLE
eukprot:3493702-Rhodomonas_salina.2